MFVKHFPVYPPSPSGVLEPTVIVDDTHREISEFYTGVITYLAPRWRVVICKGRIQYILQYRSSKHLNKGMWLGKSYPTTRDALWRICSSRGLLSDPNAMAVLRALPEYARDYLKN